MTISQKKTLASYFNTTLVQNSDVLNDVKEMVMRRLGSIDLNKRNQDQSLVPENCIVLRNGVGTAPGMLFKQSRYRAITFSLPGVPHEMKWLYENRITQILKKEFELQPQTYDLFSVMGHSESGLAHMLESWENDLPLGWKPAYLPSAGIIKLRIFKPAVQDTTYDTHIIKLKEILGKSIVAINEESIQITISKILKSNNLTLCTAESCTGGNIAKSITEIPGASAYFRGSIIAYSNDIKRTLLNVDNDTLTTHGAVSQETAEQMAKGAAKALNCNIAIATTGVAGPDGGTEAKPVGTIWIAICINGNITSKKHTFGTLRSVNIERSTNAAMLLLLRLLQSTYEQ